MVSPIAAGIPSATVVSVMGFNIENIRCEPAGNSILLDFCKFTFN